MYKVNKQMEVSNTGDKEETDNFHPTQNPMISHKRYQQKISIQSTHYTDKATWLSQMKYLNTVSRVSALVININHV